MPIVSKPRQIRIDLDPDSGNPVALFLESTRCVEEDGVKVADLQAHIESLDPSSEQAKAVLDKATQAAIAALLPYQQELQAVAIERDQHKARAEALEAELAVEKGKNAAIQPPQE